MDDSQQRFSTGFFSASGSGSTPSGSTPNDGSSNDGSPNETSTPNPQAGETPPETAASQDWSVSSGFWNAQPSAQPSLQPSERSPQASAPQLPIIQPLTPPAADDFQAEIPEESDAPTDIAYTADIADTSEAEEAPEAAEAVVQAPFAEAPDLSVPPLPEPLPEAPTLQQPPQQPLEQTLEQTQSYEAETLHQPNAEVAQLRAENRQLYEHIAQMEELLQECQATLELQMMRSQTQESLIERQTQELEETHQALQQTQTEADRILTELEKSGDILQRQAQELANAQQLAAHLQGTLEDTQREVSRYQVVVETLTQELDNSQTRISHLEETCHQLQQRSLNQDAAIAQTEANCQELQSRLNRQQRQTLHFRSALERCLDLNLTAELSDADAPLQLPQGSIQPWSIDTTTDTAADTAADTTTPEAPSVDSAPSAIAPPTVAGLAPEVEAADPSPPEEIQTIYPSIPMAGIAHTPITLPPIGEITDADIEEPTPEPVEISPSDIVALLDWSLEESTDLNSGVSQPSDAIPDIEEVEAIEGDVIAEAEEAAPIETPIEAPVEMPIEAIAPPIQAPQTMPAPPHAPPLEQPLTHPLSNLLSLGAELLNLQGLEAPQTVARPPQTTSDPISAPVAHNPASEATVEPEIESEAAIATDSASPSPLAPDLASPLKRESLAAVELPHFS